MARRRRPRRRNGIFKNERKMKTILNDIYVGERFLDNKRYQWLGGLELDRYYPDLKIAFEYNGQQHYAPCLYFSKGKKDADKRYKQQLERDKRKVRLCKENNVRLVIIPHWTDLTKRNILRHIGRVCVS